MTLSVGSRLGPYEILAPLGAGGMGEVWRAHDKRLDREVALKVLPSVFTADPERLARFEREAKLLAQLGHPGIAAIHGLEESGGVRALVMELVEGPTLEERLRSGALPVDEVLPIARQIAEALEAAHEKGIVHRDLKPANVKVTAEGQVKVLDFGLAKALDPAAGSASPADLARSPTLMNSPTLTALQGTQLGVILGTAAYMAPEQARGRAVDKRADIWAFGVVLWEMLCGCSLFAADTVSDTLAGVLRGEIELSALPEATPPAIRGLLRRCLERDSRDRLHDIADARLVLVDVLAGRSDEVSPRSVAAPAPPHRREALAWALASLGMLAGLAGLWTARRPIAPGPPLTTRFTVLPTRPGDVEGFPAPSPDGRRMAYVLVEPGASGALWVHDFGSGEARRLDGTEGGRDPFWSPDGRFLAFFARGQLRKIAADGGPVQTICPVSDSRGGSWGGADEILFTPNAAAGIFRVGAGGGRPSLVSEIDASKGEQSRRFPWFLPDGRHFLYTSVGNSREAGIHWASLDGRDSARLVPEVTRAAFDSRGFLVFLRQEALVAQRFDPERGRLEGDATPLVERVGLDQEATAGSWFGISASGVLAVRVTSGTGSANQLLWLDRTGKGSGVLASRGVFAEPSLSPDDRRVAVDVTPEQGGDGDIWVFDAAGTDRGTRLTFGPAANETPVWSPDGTRIVYSSPRSKGYTLLAKSVNGVGPEEVLLEVGASAWPDDWSRDGRLVLFERYTADGGSDLWILQMTGARRAEPLLATPANESHAVFSPDGRYLAYVSDETGTPQVYVQTVPPSGGKWQISVTGGDEPLWRADGRELYYVSLERRLTAVPIRSFAPFSIGEPQTLFALEIPALRPTGNRTFYAPTRDGGRFLVNSLVGRGSEPGIRVTLDWAPPAPPR